MNPLSFTKCLLFFLLLTSSPLLARDDGDYRMRCRLAVGGHLLNLQNKIDVLSNLLADWRKKKLSLSDAMRQTQSEMSKLGKQIDQGAFDRVQEEKMLGLENRLANLRFELNQIESSFASKTQELAEAKRDLDNFKLKIDKVFRIHKPVQGKVDGGYDFTVSFKHQCGKYEYLCPLPTSQRQALMGVAAMLSKGIDCKRYAQILPPDR